MAEVVEMAGPGAKIRGLVTNVSNYVSNTQRTAMPHVYTHQLIAEPVPCCRP